MLTFSEKLYEHFKIILQNLLKLFRKHFPLKKLPDSDLQDFVNFISWKVHFLRIFQNPRIWFAFKSCRNKSNLLLFLYDYLYNISNTYFPQTRKTNHAFQCPKGSFDILFIQLVSRVTKTNQDSPRSKMGRSFRIWSPFCHPTKIELKCAFFSIFS